jgi:hypothetical protein
MTARTTSAIAAARRKTRPDLKYDIMFSPLNHVLLFKSSYSFRLRFSGSGVLRISTHFRQGEQTVFERKERSFDAGGDAQLIEYVINMVFDGANTDTELTGDVCIATA